MDFSPAIKQLISQLWWLIPIIVIASLSKTPWFKGWLGEVIVSLSAKFLLDPKEYRAIHNVTLQTPAGTTQVDHVFVSRYGVFVVETKSYSGWIYGNAKDAYWTQKIFKTTNKFQNPLRQNYKHLKALEELLELPPEKLLSVIVFVGGSTFKTEMPDNVTYAGGYIRYIKSKTQTQFSPTEVDAIYQAILTGRLKPSLATSREHVKNLQARLSAEPEKICPKCGSPLVQRTVKSGERAGSLFWGCSQFPKCRTVINC